MSHENTILVTGAGGFIGGALVQHLREAGYNTVGWSRVDCDLSNRQAVSTALSVCNPSIIFHLAAIGAAANDQQWIAAAREVMMIENLLGSMSSDTRLVYTGSMSEYGYSASFAEGHPRYPRSMYGFAKATAVDRALVAAMDRGQDVRVARLFGVYGPGEASGRLVPHLVNHLSRGQAAPLGDGAQVRDFVHVTDICNLLLALAEQNQPAYRIVNFGTGVGVSVRQVAERVANLLGVSHKLLQFNAIAARPIDEVLMVANTGRLETMLPVPPQHWLVRDGLADDYVRHLLENRIPPA